MRNLKRKIDDMGIKRLRAVSCIANAITTLIWIQLSRMGMPLADVAVVLFGFTTIVLWYVWKTTPDGIPTRADIRKENEAYDEKVADG